VWICAITASTVLAQQQSFTLNIGNEASLSIRGKVAPGSLAGYSVTFRSPVPYPFPSGQPKLTLRQETGLEIPLETNMAGLLSGQFYVPNSVQHGPATVTLQVDDYVATGTVDIVPTAPALYVDLLAETLDAQVIRGTPEPPKFREPIHPGDTFTVWGTGLGNASAAEVRARIGTRTLDVLYAGAVPHLRGVDQYNLRVPPGATLPDTCFTGVELTVRGTAVPSGTLPTSTTGDPCRHPLNLTSDQLATLDRDEPIPVASFVLSNYTARLYDPVTFDPLELIERQETAGVDVRNQWSRRDRLHDP